MNGLRRLFYAGLAATLRAVAWVPLGIGHAIADLADACEARSR